jgi:hypothetical protein
VNPREIVRATFEGRPRDRLPVAVPYSFLMHREHWQEITGEPPWTYHRWLYADPGAHVDGYRLLRRALPFDILEPVGAPTRQERECVRVERRAEGCFVVNTRTGESRRVSEDLPHMEGGGERAEARVHAP